ncbi:phosphatidylcholine transfer protein-like [Branchiostoma lanceolatum]|uniref:phosphatidylcholine transfer protein-like n=1 Tax=Branchiostoma lanceolatum TaxID=7740 RepID=UPI0034563506
MAVVTFEDKEFENVCKELESPQLDGGWEFFTESHDVQIHRLYREESGLYEYKVLGTLSDVSPSVCADVYMDLEYRKHWDSYVNELYEREVEGKKVIYWHVNFPMFMSNRDYVYMRELREFDVDCGHVWAVLAQSTTLGDVPEKDGVIRVDDYKCSLVFASDGKQGTKAFMYYYDNPKGMIPTFIINWAAKTGVPGFLTSMQKACRKYPEFCSKRKTASS